MIKYDPQTRLIDLTVGELMELLESIGGNIQPKKESRKVFGIAGIASIFNCSIATANRIKKADGLTKR